MRKPKLTEQMLSALVLMQVSKLPLMHEREYPGMFARPYSFWFIGEKQRRGNVKREHTLVVSAQTAHALLRRKLIREGAVKMLCQAPNVYSTKHWLTPAGRSAVKERQ